MKLIELAATQRPNRRGFAQKHRFWNSAASLAWQGAWQGVWQGLWQGVWQFRVLWHFTEQQNHTTTCFIARYGWPCFFFEHWNSNSGSFLTIIHQAWMFIFSIMLINVVFPPWFLCYVCNVLCFHLTSIPFKIQSYVLFSGMIKWFSGVQPHMMVFQPFVTSFFLLLSISWWCCWIVQDIPGNDGGIYLWKWRGRGAGSCTSQRWQFEIHYKRRC